MFLSLGLGLVGLWGARVLAHALVLKGLRAPRVAALIRPESLGLAAQPVDIPGPNGKTLFAWFVPAPGASKTPAVLVMHGWGANASMMLPSAAPLVDAGLAVLLLDARCHGASGDEAFTSLPRFAQDIEAGLDWLARQAQVDAARLAVIGHSVGAGAALLSATRRPDICAVVSISAFAHPYEVMRRLLAVHHIPYFGVGWYVLHHVQHVIGARFDDIAPIHSMSLVRCPVLLVHGEEDEMVPFDDARRLLAAGQQGRVQLLAVPGRHDLSEALAIEQSQVLAYLQKQFNLCGRA
ncbi:MAG: alpha/beta fold hydrolase [Rhodoferax sp.]|uniref:alpha/beta hydrolase n=1 Tax=Rhodoferax sp. TaxID=50421 RepID=UPI0027330E96|nr:alpha/beta fold hydrolase [Rhodoferax sp.]MDP2677486.1 alpha/beta fold hydrolase [Rhodoferax sp.]